MYNVCIKHCHLLILLIHRKGLKDVNQHVTGPQAYYTVYVRLYMVHSIFMHKHVYNKTFCNMGHVVPVL